MARTTIQSDLSKHKVTELSYSVRGPCQIIRNTGFSSYFVRKLNKPHSPELKFMAYDLYPLLLSLKPCEPIDLTDTRYLNQMHAPLINPLKRAPDIELHNEIFFIKPLHASTPKLVNDHDTLQFPNAPFPGSPSVSELHQETDTYPPITSIGPDDYSLSSFPSPLTLHRLLSNSDYLFFICYIPENTFKLCWFLVQINHAETTLLNLDSKHTGDYHVTFISRNPDDSHLCCNTARWWPLWHEYKNNEHNISLYGARMLFGPKGKPDLRKYFFWTDSVQLTDSSCYLHGPFNFDSHSDVITAKQHIALPHWDFLLTIFRSFSIVPPILSTLTTVKGSTKKRKRRPKPELYYFAQLHTRYF